MIQCIHTNVFNTNNKNTRIEKSLIFYSHIKKLTFYVSKIATVKPHLSTI